MGIGAWDMAEGLGTLELEEDEGSGIGSGVRVAAGRVIEESAEEVDSGGV
jgi:hypothetical protein